MTATNQLAFYESDGDLAAQIHGLLKWHQRAVFFDRWNARAERVCAYLDLERRADVAVSVLRTHTSGPNAVTTLPRHVAALDRRPAGGIHVLLESDDNALSNALIEY